MLDWVRCWVGRPRWVTIDPTGGDPLMGGPVTMTVCRACFREDGTHRTL